MAYVTGIFLDILFSAVSFWSAVFLANDLIPSTDTISSSVIPFVVFTILFIVLHVLFRTYRYEYKYMSIIEAVTVVFVSIICTIIILCVHFLNIYKTQLSVTLIYLIMYLLTANLYRFSFRAVRVIRRLLGFYGGGKQLKRVLVISDIDMAGIILRRLLQEQEFEIKPVAVLTDDKKYIKRLIRVPVFDDETKLKTIIRDYFVSEIVLFAGYYNPKRTDELKAICNHLNVDIKIYESVHPIDGDDGRRLREMILEDLLERKEIKLERTWIESFITGKDVMVTGAAGSIGSEISRQCIMFGCKTLFALDIDENGLFALDNELRTLPFDAEIVPILASIRDEARMNSVIKTLKPEVCFHAAAHKHVPMMEANPCEAIKNNVFGTMNVMKACDAYHVKKLIVISTDKAVNPSSIMGATKRVAEMIIQVYGKSTETEIAAVRFGNVLGSNGSVVPLFQKQIENGGPVTITHPDMERYFMTIPEAVQLVLQAGALARKGEIFVLDMGKSVKVVDLAKTLIKLAGFVPEKDIKIEIIGLRPGEKLFEELKLDEETVDSTSHNSIFIYKPMDIDAMWLSEHLNRLDNAIKAEDEQVVLEELFEMMPSIYRKPTVEIFDKVIIDNSVFQELRV